VPSLPLRGWILLGALFAFAVAVLGVLYWAQFTGRAGSQRGLVVHNELPESITVTLAGQTRTITPDDEETFVVKRNQFPALVTWDVLTANAQVRRSEREVAYDFVADAEFRVSIDENGMYPTSDYRDTPVAENPTEVP
jgi:hypothetical protein